MRLALAPLVPFALLLAGCALPRGPAAAPPPRERCEMAQRERARVAPLVAEGRLDRAARVVARADRLCPADAGESKAARAAIEAELGRAGPDAEALFAQGMAAKRAGRAAQAQRLLDRARARLEAETGQPVHVEPAGLLEGRPAAITWSHGRWAVAHGQVISVIDGATLREQLRLVGHEAEVRSVAFSPDGKTLASGSKDRTVRLWDSATGAPKGALHGHRSEVTAVAFALGGAALVSGSRDATVRLWDLDPLTERTRLASHALPVSGVAVSPDGKTVAAASDDKSVRLWDASSGKMLHTFDGPYEFRFVTFSPDGKRVIGTHSGRGAHQWDVVTGKALADLPVAGPVAFSSDGRLVAHFGSSAELWDVATARAVSPPHGLGRPASAAALRPDGEALLTANEDDWTLELWDTRTGHVARRSGGRPGSMRAIAWSPREALLAAGSDDTSVWLFRVDGQAEPRLLRGEGTWKMRPSGGADMHALGERGAVAFSPAGTTLAWASGDATVRLWDVGPGDTTRRIDHWHEVSSLAFRPRTDDLATLSDSTVRFWSAASGLQLGQYPIGFPFSPRRPSYEPRAPLLAFHPVGALLAAASESVQAHDVSSGLERSMIGEPDGGIRSLAFHPAGILVALGLEDGTVRLWDVVTSENVKTLGKHDKTVTALAWSPDGKALASSSWDGTVRLWDLGSGRQRNRLSHGRPVAHVAWSPDGKLLATSDTISLRLWSAADGDELVALGSAAGASWAATPGPEGRVETFGDVPREAFVCRAGPRSFPLDLCEDGAMVRGLIPKVLARDRSYLDP